MSNIKRIITWLIPTSLLQRLLSAYHFLWALGSAVYYRFPSKKMRVVAVTGTKGKTTTTELIAAILREAGYKVAVSNTIHFVVGDKEEQNLWKMSMPGRGFIQRFLARARSAKCSWAVLEITSQGVLQHRHRFIDLDALIFTNIAPEHIESHGSFESYLDAKLDIARLLHRSSKKEKYMIVNTDDEHHADFLRSAGNAHHVRFSFRDAEPATLDEEGTSFTFKDNAIRTSLPGAFNVYNMYGAATFASLIGVPVETIQKALENFRMIRGRLERIKGSGFDVYVDYAHTPESLEAVYRTFPNKRIIAILGNTGGGRDTWKRGVMARIAEKYADEIIFANEDPYDEDPMKIVEEMYEAISDKEKAEIILDRREAIHSALARAQKGDVVLITGKGTDPYIMEAGDKKTPWDDATVVREELEKKDRGAT